MMVAMRFLWLLLTMTLAWETSYAQQVASQKPVGFTRDIMAILTKHGCNSSTCHGGVKGKGGFKLSLDGLDPGEDYRWIAQGGTYQVLSPEALPPISPRVNVQEPEKSLLLLKPSMPGAHRGGRLFEPDSTDYATILEWVAKGSPYGQDIRESWQGIEVSSQEVVLEPGQTHQLRVTALFAGGQRQDITREVRFESLNRQVATVDRSGVIGAQEQGETSIVLRWIGQYAHTRVGVKGGASADYAEAPRNNFIDDYVFAKLRRFSIQPSGLSSDQEFLRRVCLDLTGTLPPPRHIREFVDSQDPRKRQKLIDILLNSPEWVDLWTSRFSDLFRVRGSYGWILPFWEWVRSSVATNTSYDQMAQEAIAVQGYPGPSHKFMVGINKPPPVEQMVNETLRVFTGRRLDCAQCHNHPFDNWTQNQYWGLASFFSRMTNTGWGHDNAVFDDLNGHEEDYLESDPDLKFRRVVHPRSKQLPVPAFLDGTVLPEERRDDPRMELARWVISHPYFAEAAVNRMWGHFFGRGIVDPVDDFRVANPPSHPDLLAALAGDFRENGFDLKHLMHRIVTSRTYQLSSKTNQSNRRDEINYSHALPRPLEAVVLLDAISQVTGVPESFGNMPAGTRAVQMPFAQGFFLGIFDRPLRDAVPEPTGKPNLGQALHMLAGTTFNRKLAEEGGRLQRLLKNGASDREIIEEFYLAALTRLPREPELSGLQSMFQERARQEVAEDLVWALVTSREFSENH